MKKIYLAGFDVFRVDAIEHGERLKAMCKEVGLEGVYPMDNALPPGTTGPAAAQWICKANLNMLCCADAVVANLGSFRGSEPDSGTVFEIGFAVAKGIPVWVYFQDHSTMIDVIKPDEHGLCAAGYLVEDFGLSKNLMLACTWTGSSQTVEEAISGIAKHLDQELH